MNSEKMTIHKALAELKVLDDRLYKAICNGTFVVSNKHSNEKISGITIAAFKEKMKADNAKVNDLIARRNAMKRAVVLSNANTMVNVAGIEYTVAEAIELKNHGMNFKRELMNTMVNQLRKAEVDVNRNSGEDLEKKAERYILDVISAQPKDSKMTVDNEAMKALRKTYIENNTYDLVDPLEVSKVIEALDKEINEFNTEVDAALSCSNALTVIEFEY